LRAIRVSFVAEVFASRTVCATPGSASPKDSPVASRRSSAVITSSAVPFDLVVSARIRAVSAWSCLAPSVNCAVEASEGRGARSGTVSAGSSSASATIAASTSRRDAKAAFSAEPTYPSSAAAITASATCRALRASTSASLRTTTASSSRAESSLRDSDAEMYVLDADR
jgi:hypothetical protein